MAMSRDIYDMRKEFLDMHNKIMNLQNDLQMNDLSEVGTSIIKRGIQSLEDSFRDHVDYARRWADVAQMNIMLGGIHTPYSINARKDVANRENL